MLHVRGVRGLYITRIIPLVSVLVFALVPTLIPRRCVPRESVRSSKRIFQRVNGLKLLAAGCLRSG
jgi:hypothetical protein